MIQMVGIFIAGALGTLMRYFLSHASIQVLGSAFPYGTALVNILGCLIIGILIGISEGKIHADMQLLLIVGFCGGLTTFSTFVLDFSQLLRSEAMWKALTYLIGSVFIGFLIFRLGLAIGESV